MMQQVMGKIGQSPGLLGRIPGFKQLGQLAQMKNMDLGSMFGKDAGMMEQAMGLAGPQQMQMPAGMPRGYSPPMTRRRWRRRGSLGYSIGPQKAGMTDADREALKERRKREKANKKKNRRK